MSRVVAVQEHFSRRSIAFRSRMAALCTVWTTRTLKRAIADLAPMSDQDYRDFGLDKDILRGLRQLRYELECCGLRSVAQFCSSDHQKLADTKLFNASTREPLVIARMSSGL
jgi:hypothetical protein